MGPHFLLQVLSFDQWLKIDLHERTVGEARSKTREKVTNVAEMHKLAGL